MGILRVIRVGWAVSGVVLAVGVTGCSSGTKQAAYVPPTPTAQQYVYLPQTLSNGTGAIADFNSTATGTVSLQTALTDSSGGLGYLCVDGSGNFYAVETVQGSSFSTFSIVEFGSGNGGAATPIRRISGSATGLVASSSLTATSSYPIAVNSSGAIAVGLNVPGAEVIELFNAGANGNVAPSATIPIPSANAGTIVHIALSPSGAVSILSQGLKNYQLLTFPAGSNGATTPTVVATFAANTLADGLLADASGNLYVASTLVTSVNGYLTSYAPTIQEFAAGATTATKSIAPANDAVRMFGLQLDSSGNLYVFCQDLSGTNDTIQVFSASATGAASPTATISSSAFTGLDGSIAVY
jgi:hypothetical protein